MSSEPATLDDLLVAIDSTDVARRSAAARRLTEFAEDIVDRLLRSIARNIRNSGENPGTLAFALRSFNLVERSTTSSP